MKVIFLFTKLFILSRLVLVDMLAAVEQETISEAFAHVNAEVVLNALAYTVAEAKARQ